MRNIVVDSAVHDFFFAHDVLRVPAFPLLAAAIFFEELISVVLDDREITQENLGSADAMLRFAEIKLER